MPRPSKSRIYARHNLTEGLKSRIVASVDEKRTGSTVTFSHPGQKPFSQVKVAPNIDPKVVAMIFLHSWLEAERSN